MFARLQCGIDLRTSGRIDCDITDVNSAPDESAKESSYFYVHGSHLEVALAWSFPSPCFGRLCSHVAVALAWLLHHLPSSKSLDYPLSSLWTILPIDIKSPAKSDDVCVMLDWASVRWAFVFFITSSLLFFLLLFPCDARYPSQLLKEVSLIGRHWKMCDTVVFAHLQGGIDLRTNKANKQ